jgi:hypothetical protein
MPTAGQAPVSAICWPSTPDRRMAKLPLPHQHPAGAAHVHFCPKQFGAAGTNHPQGQWQLLRWLRFHIHAEIENAKIQPSRCPSLASCRRSNWMQRRLQPGVFGRGQPDRRYGERGRHQHANGGTVASGGITVAGSGGTTAAAAGTTTAPGGSTAAAGGSTAAAGGPPRSRSGQGHGSRRIDRCPRGKHVCAGRIHVRRRRIHACHGGSTKP